MRKGAKGNKVTGREVREAGDAKKTPKTETDKAVNASGQR
jgi:hypothetical protein